MATGEEEITDLLWEEMKTLAVEQQQCLYELLPDCTIYKCDEHKYLKQNIGYAIYGPPKETENADTTQNSDCFYKTENPNDIDTTDTDATDTVDYNEDAKNLIDKIYNKICSCTVEIDNSEPIYFGIIYNMIFRLKTNTSTKTETSKKKEIKKEVKKKTEEDVKEEVKKDELLIVSPIPIFVIRKSIQKKSDTKNPKSVKQENTSTTEIQYETWYIDLGGRVYKSWTDYIENNNLPKCTMVLPKDGFYQANPDYPVTEDYSTVWLDIIDSPACSLATKICNGIDIASSIVGLGTAGLSVAALFTPLAPVVAVTGLAAAGVSGLWAAARSTQQLVKRSQHEESIHLLDKEAFGHYLGIAGTAFGLGAIGGSVIISHAVARGITINSIARITFNTVQGGNLLLNGIGIIYQSYCMYDKYQTEKTVSIGDALNLATHIMFFCGSVVKIQFASDIIESTQGKIMTDYKENLGSKRLRKKYNRIVRRAAENNECKISENAEVIRYIRNRQELVPSQSVTNTSSKQILNDTSRNIVWSFEHGKLEVNGIVLLDPVEFVLRLVKLGIFIEIDQNSSSGSQNYANDSNIDQLERILCELLSKFYLSNDCPTKLPTVSDFEPLLREMSSMNFNEDCLKKLFKIVERLMKRSRNMKDFLLKTFAFVWQYCKANLKQWGLSMCYCTQSVSSNKVLQKIITAVFEAIDMMVNNLFSAFAIYIDV
ncbi:uncharacterized protein LOC105433789 [Pogonomyrmex barbatus]|uniref:Uncharacterized protein LOC105433789 n=1 Tax=Pogonomyrmex barbatus TaxID=144034 RepID=A0A6I9XN87_9HYME|nr:uncharacterized protein LOC105433789 [Pogonomyrmex barbatus]